jgi:hypothetical protein
LQRGRIRKQVLGPGPRQRGPPSGEDLGATLPESIEELYTARGLDLLRHPSGSFAAALAGHDAAGDRLRPGVSVRLLVSPADELVPRANSEHYLSLFSERSE